MKVEQRCEGVLATSLRTKRYKIAQVVGCTQRVGEMNGVMVSIVDEGKVVIVEMQVREQEVAKWGIIRQVCRAAEWHRVNGGNGESERSMEEILEGMLVNHKKDNTEKLRRNDSRGMKRQRHEHHKVQIWWDTW